VSSISASSRAKEAGRGSPLRNIGTWDDAGAFITSSGITTTDEYELSKAALAAWLLDLSAELLDRLIRVNVVSPGAVESESFHDFATVVGRAKVDRGRSVVGRNGSPDDIARVIDFLINPASNWVNGIDLRVDGGLMNSLLHRREANAR
jgi:NAD(P)-dependent dehydrogenase (short-subunit alcohol dehydrogenase family)